MQDFPDVVQLKETTSTNSYLAKLWEEDPGSLPPYQIVCARYQSSGQGRLGRTWEAPAGTALLCSILVPTSEDRVSLLPLATGAAVTSLVRDLVPGGDVSLKWPNDVLVDGAKVSGILCQSLGEFDGTHWAVAGIGVNLTQRKDQLPKDRPATSIKLAGGAVVEPGPLAQAIAGRLADLMEEPRPELLDHIRKVCGTLGQHVRAEIPGKPPVVGLATNIDSGGALQVEDSGGATHTLSAADIEHLESATPFAGSEGDPHFRD